MQRNRSRLALLGILALALGVTAGLTASEAAAAKKKKGKSGGTVDITKVVGAAIPDNTATTHGLLTSTIDVGGKKFRGTQVRDVNATVQTTGLQPDALSNLSVLLTAPNGATVWLFAVVSGQNLGPLTFDDETFMQLFSSDQPPRDPTQVTRPYIGTVQPYCYFAFGGCPLSVLDNGPVTGTWTLRVFDGAGIGLTSILNQWRIQVVAGKPYRTS
jgi:subtilisin-like proprotein convertase family protein